jgi:hypothetical protein
MLLWRGDGRASVVMAQPEYTCVERALGPAELETTMLA